MLYCIVITNDLLLLYEVGKYMENRRINKRFKLHQMIEISFNEEENLLNVLSLDISETGVKCKLRNPIKSSSEIFLMFEIPGDIEPHIIKCYGEISWQNRVENEYFAGIIFKNLYNKDKTVLNEYIETLEQSIK